MTARSSIVCQPALSENVTTPTARTRGLVLAEHEGATRTSGYRPDANTAGRSGIHYGAEESHAIRRQLMVTLTLTPEEVEILSGVLDSYLADLHTEIHHTDN